MMIWVENVVAEIQQYVNWPILTLKQDDVSDYLALRKIESIADYSELAWAQIFGAVQQRSLQRFVNDLDGDSRHV
jgi:hypothetical protein